MPDDTHVEIDGVRKPDRLVELGLGRALRRAARDARLRGARPRRCGSTTMARPVAGPSRGPGRSLV